MILSCVVLGLFYKPDLSRAQLRDMEEERFALDKATTEALEKNIPGSTNRTHQDKDVRYVAGKDGKWFTQDDEVCHYYLKDYDQKGRLFKRAYVKPGKDNIPFTSDDDLQDYQIYSYGSKDQIIKETSFDSRKRKLYTSVYAYDPSGKKTKITRFDSKGKETGYMSFTYDSRGLVSQDAEYAGANLEKYHRFTYDGQGRISRAVEYHFKQNGKGADGEWFTPDDVVSSAKEYFYSQDGSACKDKKYIGAGQDNKWFTPDDEIQYYTYSEFHEADK